MAGALSSLSFLMVRFKTPASPYTTAGAGSGSQNSLTIISGPMPAASPIVMPMGFVYATLDVSMGRLKDG